MMAKALFCSLLLAAAVAGAVTVAGVELPDDWTVDGQRLVLNGAGTREYGPLAIDVKENNRITDTCFTRAQPGPAPSPYCQSIVARWSAAGSSMRLALTAFIAAVKSSTRCYAFPNSAEMFRHTVRSLCQRLVWYRGGWLPYEFAVYLASVETAVILGRMDESSVTNAGLPTSKKNRVRCQRP